MEYIEVSAKTIEDAITEACQKLSVVSDKLDYEVIQEPSSGFLGINAKPAIIKASIKEEEKTIDIKAKDFLTDVFNSMNIAVVIDAKYDDIDHTLDIDLSGDDMGMLIGKRGQTLDSLQYLVSLVVNKGVDNYIRVKVDTENYRQRRKDTLENLAKNIAYKVKRTRRSVALEPMNPYERRIIHSALQNDKYVTTHSEGEEPHRKVGPRDSRAGGQRPAGCLLSVPQVQQLLWQARRRPSYTDEQRPGHVPAGGGPRSHRGR